MARNKPPAEHFLLPIVQGVVGVVESLHPSWASNPTPSSARRGPYRGEPWRWCHATGKPTATHYLRGPQFVRALACPQSHAPKARRPQGILGAADQVRSPGERRAFQHEMGEGSTAKQRRPRPNRINRSYAAAYTCNAAKRLLRSVAKRRMPSSSETLSMCASFLTSTTEPPRRQRLSKSAVMA